MDNIFGMNDEEKEEFVKILNKKGFLLEDKTIKLLQDRGYFPLRDQVFEHNNERVEIDFILETEKKIYIIECKKTDYTWFFPKAKERGNEINFIFDSDEGISTKTKGTRDFFTAWFDMSIKFKDDGGLSVTRRGNPETSYDNIHNKLKQILKETEAYMYHKITNKARFFNKIIIPLIVTNSILCQIDYSKSSLNNKGDLVEFPIITPLNCVVYNFPEILKWDTNKKIIENKSRKGNHTKSVFITNIDKLIETIDLIELQNL